MTKLRLKRQAGGNRVSSPSPWIGRLVETKKPPITCRESFPPQSKKLSLKVLGFKRSIEGDLHHALNRPNQFKSSPINLNKISRVESCVPVAFDSKVQNLKIIRNRSSEILSFSGSSSSSNCRQTKFVRASAAAALLIVNYWRIRCRSLFGGLHYLCFESGVCDRQSGFVSGGSSDLPEESSSLCCTPWCLPIKVINLANYSKL